MESKIYAPGFNTGLTCENCGCRKTNAVLRKIGDELSVIITCTKCGSNCETDLGMIVGFSRRSFEEIKQSQLILYGEE